ncbi:hypothetical protein SAMN06269301_1424 [Geobacter sp. DSM 9736]|nr:hypothetical protein SAMN06269301_1424 [Geobacter sp. DSM 9736]
MKAGEKVKIGVISDTHGVLRPAAVAALQGSDLIIHAGDVGAPAVLEELRGIAPVVAVRGNCDRGQWADALPDREIVLVESACLCVLHDLEMLDLEPVSAGVCGVISGHSHTPRVREKEGVLYLNPGSAGPRRFRLPAAVALLHVEGTRLSADILILEEGK